MKRNFIVFLLLSFCIVPVFSAQAEYMETQVMTRDVHETTIYPRDFDRVVFDMTLLPAGEPDNLVAFTLRNGASAFDGLYIQKMMLYVDRGEPGFQNAGVDEWIAQGTWQGASQLYAFENLSVFIPQTGVRLLVTVETTQGYSTDGLVQMELTSLVDSNGNGKYEAGDSGLFTKKKHNGPEKTYINKYRQTIVVAETDRNAPRCYIQFPQNGGVDRSPVFISGHARDVGASNPSRVEIGIGKDGIWKWADAESIVGNYALFALQWKPSPGTYHLKTRCADYLSNLYEQPDAQTIIIE